MKNHKNITKKRGEKKVGRIYVFSPGKSRKLDDECQKRRRTTKFFFSLTFVMFTSLSFRSEVTNNAANWPLIHWAVPWNCFFFFGLVGSLILSRPTTLSQPTKMPKLWAAASTLKQLRSCKSWRGSAIQSKVAGSYLTLSKPYLAKYASSRLSYPLSSLNLKQEIVPNNGHT